jgi:GAF domain-containing protein
MEQYDMAVDNAAFTSSLITLLDRADVPLRAGEEDVQARLADVLSAATGVLGVDSVGLMMLDGDDVLRVVGVSDAAAAAIEGAQQRLRVGPGVDCVRSGETVTVDDLSASTEYAAVWEAVRDRPDGASGAGVRSVLSAPVRVRGETVGTLNALHRDPQRWHESQVRAVAAYASVIAILLRLEAATQTGRSLVRTRRPEER